MLRLIPLRPNRAFFRYGILVLCLGYALLCVSCATWQRKCIYFPPKLNPTEAADLGRREHLERWTDCSGGEIGWKRMSPMQPPEGAVLITHGNGNVAQWCSHFADVIQQVSNLDVFILEYPGYGDQPGHPSERSIEAAAGKALDALDTNRPVYVVGESLGTGVAAWLAGHYPDRIAGAVLLAPYDSLISVAQHHLRLLPASLLLVDRYPATKFLRHFHGPVAIFAGGRDLVIPLKFSRRLYESYAGPKRIWEFPDRDHGSIMSQSPEVWRDALSFLAAH